MKTKKLVYYIKLGPKYKFLHQPRNKVKKQKLKTSSVGASKSCAIQACHICPICQNSYSITALN